MHHAMDVLGHDSRGRGAWLAARTGLSPKACGKWLAGESMPETKRIRFLAKLLQVDALWLLTGEGEQQDAAAEDHAEYIPDPGAARSRLAMIARIIAMADADVRVAAEWLDRSFPAESGPVPPGIRDRTI